MKLLSSSCSVLKDWSYKGAKTIAVAEGCVACAEMYCEIVMFERLMESMVVQGAQKKGQITFR